jgi:hypothetical protein
MKNAKTAGAVRVHSRRPIAQKFFSPLSPEEMQLLCLRNELYDGLWDEMEADLRNRLQRKPYVFRLANRIEDDLARIARLRAYEERYGVDSGTLVANSP